HVGVLAFSNWLFDGGADELRPLPLGRWRHFAAPHHAITLRNASWNLFISSGRPMVRRMCVGHTGHRRPTYTFSACRARMTSPTGRFTSIMKQFDLPGT